MSSQRIVIDTATEKQYELRQELGRGMTAAVYKALPTDSADKSSVAIKIAYESMSDEETRLFWGELDALKALSGSTHVPQAVRGEFSDQSRRADKDKTPILILELVSPEWSLSQRISAATGADKEKLALQSARQYAELLDVMYRTGVSTRGDRKLPDLKWNPDHPARLIVLDWNRAVIEEGLLSDRNPAEQEKELRSQLKSAPEGDRRELQAKLNRLVRHRGHIQTDIRIFGRMWAQLLNLEPNADALRQNTTVSRGMRQILITALESREFWGFQEPKQLQDKIKKHLERWDKTDEELLRKANDLKGQAESQPAWERQRAAEEVLTLADLAERRRDNAGAGSVGTSGPPTWNDLKKWAADINTDIDRRFAEIVNTVRYYMGLSLYDRARGVLGQALRESNALPAYEVVLHRLAVAVEVGAAGYQQRLSDMAGRQQTLFAIIDELGQAEPTEPAISDAASKYDVVVGERASLAEIGHPLKCELLIWDGLLSNDNQAVSRYWEELRKIKPEYASSLRRAFVSLDTVLSDVTIGAATYRIVDDRKKAFEEAMQRLRRALQEPGVTGWPDSLKDDIGACEKAFHTLIKPADNQKADYELVKLARDVSNDLPRKHYLHLSERIGKLSPSANEGRSLGGNNWTTSTTSHPITSDDTDRRGASAQIRKDDLQILLTRLAQYATERAKERGWPDELVGLSDLAKQMPTINLEHLGPTLKKWKDAYKDFREKLGINDETEHNRYEQLARLEDAASPNAVGAVTPGLGGSVDELQVDQILQQAAARNTQLFSRPDSNEWNYTVQNLLVRRHTSRLTEALDNLHRRLDQLAKQLGPTQDDRVASVLPRDQLDEVVRLRADIDTVLSDLENADLELRVGRLQGWSNRLEDALWQVDFGRKADFTDQVTKLESELDNFHSVVEKWDKTGSQIDQIAQIRASLDAIGGNSLVGGTNHILVQSGLAMLTLGQAQLRNGDSDAAAQRVAEAQSIQQMLQASIPHDPPNNGSAGAQHVTATPLDGLLSLLEIVVEQYRNLTREQQTALRDRTISSESIRASLPQGISRELQLVFRERVADSHPSLDESHRLEKLIEQFKQLEDSSDTLPERKQIVQDLLALPPQTSQILIKVAHISEMVQLRQRLTDKQNKLSQDWLKVIPAEGKVAEDAGRRLSWVERLGLRKATPRQPVEKALASLSANNNLPTETVSFIRGWHQQEAPPAYIQSLKRSVEPLIKLSLEKLTEPDQIWQEHVLKMLIFLRWLAGQLDITDDATADQTSQPPVADQEVQNSRSSDTATEQPGFLHRVRSFLSRLRIILVNADDLAVNPEQQSQFASQEEQHDVSSAETDKLG